MNTIKHHRQKLATAQESYRAAMTATIQAEAIKAGEAFLAKFPNRKLDLRSGNGVAFYLIDGEILHIDLDRNNYRYSYGCDLFSCWSDKHRYLLRDLIGFFEWYESILEAGECLSDFLENYSFNEWFDLKNKDKTF